MPLRVAFDLDGTIADMHFVLRQEAKRLFGEAPAPDAASDDDGGTREGGEATKAVSEMALSPRQRSQLWDHVKRIQNFWAGLPEIESGIVARIAQVATERRWEVIFLTTRPLVDGDTTQVQSQRWLQAHGFALPSVFVVQNSRGKVADALDLDAVVDDRPENCLDVAVDSKARPILIWPGDPVSLPPGAKRLGVRVVSTIADALALLERLDDAKQESGMVRSLKKLFGKETPA